MTSAKTPEQLADAIECLVAVHIDEVRRAAQQAIERSFSRPVGAKPSKRRVRRDARTGRPAKRRSAEELGELCDKLYELVCARPGEPMIAFADQIGLSARALELPMSKLKAQGRIRSVGERNLT